MVSFRSPLARMIGHRWPIALILAASMAGVILMVITVATVLEIRQERHFARQDLEMRGRLLANALNDSLADPLYFLDVDRVEDVTVALEASQEGLSYVQVFRHDGSLLTDTLAQGEPRGSLATGFVKSVIQTQEPVLEFHGDDLEVTSPIRAGNQIVGIVHFDLSTASLHTRLMEIIWDHVWQGLALLAVASLLAFAVARFVTKPLQALRAAALGIGRGDLDYPIPVGGTEETASLGQALNSMRTQLKSLYQDLEGQVSERTQELSKANENLEVEIVERKRLAQESQLMAEIGRTVSASVNINEVYESLGEEIRKLIPFDRIDLALIDQERGTVSPNWILGTDVPGRRRGTQVPLAGTFAEVCLQARSPMMLDIHTEQDLSHRLPGILLSFHAGLRSFLGVPLYHRDNVVAFLQVCSTTPGIYSQHHLDLAERIGAQIAGAIANSQLYEQLNQAQEAVRWNEELFRQIAENIPEVIFLVDHETYEILYINPAVEEIWGRPRESFYQQPTTWLDAIHPDEIERVNIAFQKQHTTGEFREEFRIIRPDGSVRWINDYVVPIRDELGQISRLVGIAEDVTERRQAEDLLKTSLDEKEVLLKEINHRVKNNLQIISSLLNLQSRDIQDEKALRAFDVSQDRIKAMALVHEKLYLSDDLARVDFGEYIKSLAADLGSSYGLGSRDIELKIDVENILLGVDTAIPCGVIVNELVANSLKHAFPGDRSGEIAISFREVDGQYDMAFKDDGVGFPEDLDTNRPSSLGLTIVNALIGQLGGTISLSRNGGSEISITFPAK